MRKLIIAVLLLISTLTYSQTYSIQQDTFPSNTELDTWCGTNDLNTKDCTFEVTYCSNCKSVIIKGHVTYRKYYNSKDKKQIFWDIDSFSDEWHDPFHYNIGVLGFKLD